MHEVSLIRNVFRTLEHEFGEEELDCLQQIDLRVGALSNVEPTLMQNAFDAVTQDENKYTDVALVINVVPVKIKCEVCGEVSEVQNNLFKCSNGHPSGNLIQGTELLIEKVHFAE